MKLISIPIECEMEVKWSTDVGMFVSYTPTFDIYSQGETEKEALVALTDAIQLFVQTVIKHNFTLKINTNKAVE